ncbi:MAG: hypothetical protein N4A72_07825 [Bacteroidales bacterium]|jgi:hypothetical protein|nr:hypothetical protein [Bacteroidales bacterium]
MKRILLLLLANTLLFINAVCQSGDDQQFVVNVKVDRIEPSKYLIPYIKYIENEPGLSTGVPDIKVNLFNGAGNSLNMIYNASGIMANERSSYMGLGWFHDAGGIVTRVVRDLPDDMPQNGYINYAGASKLLNNYNDCTPSQADNITNYDGKDYEPDIFYFFTKSFRGRFVIDKAGNVNLIPKSNIKITYIKDSNGEITGFTIIPPGGARYIFESGERANVSIDNNQFSFTSGWRLMKIESHIEKSAFTNIKFIKAKYNETRHFADVKLEQDGVTPYSYQKTYNVSFTSNMLPRQIAGSSAILTFNYARQRTGDIDYLYNMPDEDHPEYPYVDMKGRVRFFNNNESVLLDSINIKYTKNELEYVVTIDGANSVGTHNIDNFLPQGVRIAKRFKGIVGWTPEVELATQFSYNNMPEPGINYVSRQGMWGYLTAGADQSLIFSGSATEEILDPMTDGKTNILPGAVGFLWADYPFARMLKTIVSQDGSVKEYTFEPNRFIYQDKEYPGAGVRVKKTRDYNVKEPSKYIEQEYIYNLIDTDRSSGTLLSFPYIGERYVSPSGLNSVMRIGYVYRGITHNGVKPVYYSQVSVKKEGFGYKSYIFELPVSANYNCNIGYNIGGSTSKKLEIRNNNFSLGNNAMAMYTRPNIKIAMNRKADRSVIAKEENVYAIDKQKLIPGLRERFYVSGQQGTSQKFTSVMFYNEKSLWNLLTSKTGSIVNNGMSISNTTLFEYTNDNKKLPLKKISLRPNGDKLIEQTMFTGSYAKSQFSEESNSIFKMQDNNNISTPVEKIVYLEKPDKARYLISANIFFYRDLEYEFKKFRPTLDEENYQTIKTKTIVPHMNFELNGPLKWTDEVYKPLFIGLSNEIISDTTKMVLTQRHLKYDKSGNVLEYTDASGIINSAKYNNNSNLLEFEAKNCTYMELKKFINDEMFNEDVPVPEGSVITEYKYNYNLWKSEDINHNTKQKIYYAYDFLDRLVAVYDNDLNIVKYTERKRDGMPEIPVVSGLLGGNRYTDFHGTTQHILHKHYSVPPGASVDGKPVTSDRYLFNGPGEHVVNGVTVVNGVIINQSKTVVNVIEKPFAITFEAGMKHKGVSNFHYKFNQNTIQTAHFRQDYYPQINYTVVGGSGDYEVIIYKEYTRNIDPTQPNQNFTTEKTWSRHNRGWTNSTDKGEIKDFYPGMNKFYIWIVDKRKPGYVANSKPDISNANAVYMVDLKPEQSVITNPDIK